jgi:hypothetical protein
MLHGATFFSASAIDFSTRRSGVQTMNRNATYYVSLLATRAALLLHARAKHLGLPDVIE